MQKKSTGLYGFIDGKEHPTPVWVIDPVFEAVADFQNGLSIVTYKGNKGIINMKGQFVVEPAFDAIRFVRDTEKYFPSYEYFILYKGCSQSLFSKSKGLLYQNKSYSFEGSDETYTVFCEKNKFGLLKKDSLVLPAIHDSIRLSGSSYILVSTKDQKGNSGWKVYQKKTDRWLFDYYFTSVKTIDWNSEIFFLHQKNKTAIATKKGDYIFPLSVDEKNVCALNSDPQEQLFFVRTQDKFNIYNIKGEKINTKPYTTEGSIEKNYQRESLLDPYWKVKRNDLYGLIDRHGKEVLPCMYDTIKKNNYNEFILISGKTSKTVDLLLRPINTQLYYPLCKAKSWVDLSDYPSDLTPLYPPGIELRESGFLVDVFPDSSTVLYSAHTLERIPKITAYDYEFGSFHGHLLTYHDKFGFLSGDSERAIPPDQDKITGFKMDEKFFTLNKNGRMDIADSTAKTIGPLRFKYVYPDHDNFFFFMSDDSLFGIIDHLGKTIIEPKHKTISHYDEKNNCVWEETEESKWALVDKDGKRVNPSLFDYPQLIKEFAILSKENAKGVLGKNLNTVVPFRYENVKTEVHLLIAGKYAEHPSYNLDIYDKKGRLLFTEVENFKRLGDSTTALKIKGEWQYFLNDTIRIKTNKNSAADLPLQLGLMEDTLNNTFSRDKYSFVFARYLDSTVLHHTLINNYLLNRKMELLSELTSEEDFWQEEKDKNKISYQEDFERYPFFDYEDYSSIPPYLQLSKDKLIEQSYYTSSLSHWWQDHSYLRVMMTMKPLLNDFFEYKETKDRSGSDYSLKKQYVQVVHNSFKWLSIGEIMADSQYASVLNAVLLTRLEDVKKANYNFDPSKDPFDLAKRINFTPQGLSLEFDRPLVIHYSELIPYFKKSYLIRRLVQRYPQDE